MLAMPTFLISSRSALSAVAVLCLTGTGCGGDLLGPGVPADVQDFVTLMNNHRVSVGCAPLEWHGEVADVALAHSRDMIERDFFAHTNPDGASPFDRLNYAEIAWSGGAENIAYGYPTGEAVLEGWLNSPGHRTNIENCSLTHHGVGLEGTHWTHVFIRV